MEYFVELLVVADQEMERYHGKNLKDYVLTLMSVVSLNAGTFDLKAGMSVEFST